MCLRDTYRVEFRANSEIYNPYSLPEDRIQRGTSIESCHCDYLDSSTGQLDWEQQCKTLICRPDRRDDWNPIRAPAFGTDPYTYPYGEPGSWPSDAVARGFFTAMYEMARDREFEFSRSTSTSTFGSPTWTNENNLYTFHWDWPNTKVYPRPWDSLAISNPQDAELMSDGQATRPLKVRVSWTPTVVGENGLFDEENQVLLSRGVFMITGEHLCPLGPTMSTMYAPRWLAPNAPVEALLRQPRPLGWAMMRSETGENVVVSFDRSLAEPTEVREVTYLPGTPAEDRFTDGPTTAGRVDPALLPPSVDTGPRQAGKATAVLAYRSDLPTELTDSEVPPPLAPGESAGLWIGLVRGPDNLWLTASQALGAAAGQAPALAAPRIIFDSQTQALYLLGHEVEGGVVAERVRYVHNVLWRLALGSGTWQRLGQVEAMGRTVGYSVSFDPIKRRAVIFGGVEDGQPSERLLSVDLVTLSSRTLWSGEGLTSVTHARERHGAYLDPVGRQLYVYGGSRAGTPLDDAEAFHLVASSWITLWAGGAGGPGERYRPMVLYDRRRSKVWVAGGSASETEPTLQPWELDPQRAEWVVRPSLSALPPADPDSLERTFSQDAPPRYLIDIDEAAPLPRVEAGPGYTPDRTVPYTYREGPAELVWAGDLDGLWDVTGLEVMGNHVYVGHGTSVSAVDVTDPSQPVVVGTVSTGGLVQEITRCGPRSLCVAQTFGAQSLRLIDVSDPAHPVVTGGLFLPGLCRSVSARDSMAYLACGVRGLHLVNVLDPTAPFQVDTWRVPGIVIDVKVDRGLLAVGLFGKRVKVFRLGVASGPVLVASEHTTWRPVQLYLDGRRLHVAEVGPKAGRLCLAGIRCGFGDRVEVFELDEPAQSLIVLGEYTDPWPRVPFAKGLQDLVLAPKLAGLRVYRAESLP
jgi:hypothetical protein